MRAWALATLNLLLIPSLPFAYTPSFCVALAGAAEGAGASNAFFVMRTLEPMRKRLEAAKKDEFAAAQATRIAQQELLEQERELGLKRRRVEPDEEDRQWHRWGYTDWVWQETWTQERRAVISYITVKISLKRAPRAPPLCRTACRP